MPVNFKIIENFQIEIDKDTIFLHEDKSINSRRFIMTMKMR